MSTAYGDVVILASSGALTLMFNGIFSYLLLNESFSLRYDTLSTLLILTSQGLCIIYSKNEDEEIKKNPSISPIEKNILIKIIQPYSIFLIFILVILMSSTSYLNK